MTEETHIIHEVVKETSVWVPYAEGVATALGTFLAGAWPVITWWNNRQKKKQAQKDAIEEEARKKAPKYVETNDFDLFKRENRGQHDELGRIVEKAAQTATSAAEDIKATAKEMRQDQESHAKEQRELLTTFKMGIDQSLGEVHDKANAAVKEVALLEGRVKATEVQIGNLQREAS